MDDSKPCKCGKREKNNPLCICYSFPRQSQQILDALESANDGDIDEKIPLLLNGPNGVDDTNVANVRITRRGSMVSLISQEVSFAQRSFSESMNSCGTNRSYDAIQHCHTKKPDYNTQARAAQRKLVIASIVCLLFLIGEFVGGYLANSLAVMTDAAHLLSDFAGFMISLFAIWLGTRKATKKMSFGWHRAEVMGALLSVLIIWILTGILVYEAVMRLIKGNIKIDAVIMLITSGIGVVINIILGATLHGGHGHSHGGGSHSHGSNSSSNEIDHTESEPILSSEVGVVDPKKHLQHKDINVRAAAIHVIGDLVQSVGVFVAALLIYFKPTWVIADPISTFLFSILVLITTITILRDILTVLMEGTPKGLDFRSVMNDLRDIREVKAVHNLHIWSLTMGKPALSVHLAVGSGRSTQSVLKEASILVSKKYDIHHTTIQVERFHEQMDNCSLCEEPKD
eukprot:gene12305-13574_t